MGQFFNRDRVNRYMFDAKQGILNQNPVSPGGISGHRQRLGTRPPGGSLEKAGPGAGLPLFRGHPPGPHGPGGRSLVPLRRQT